MKPFYLKHYKEALMKSKSEKSEREIINNVKDWIKSLAVAAAVTMFVTTFIFSSAVVQGDSMYPTLSDSDRLIVKKYEAVLKTEEYRRGDIIVFESPLEDDDRIFIKRVIGLPGETIRIFQGDLYVDDIKIEEPYLADDLYIEPLFYGAEYLVPENELFVLGDNRLPDKSNDSRSFGSISSDAVEGIIVLRILPLDKAGADF